jgi:hypothetical protein
MGGGNEEDTDVPYPFIQPVLPLEPY